VILACDVITIAVAVLLDLVLIPWLGITGAAIASLIAFALNAAAKLPYSGLWPGIDWRSVLLPRWAVLGDARPALPPSPE
jgi:Na+-driven multidrug efflux pump